MKKILFILFFIQLSKTEAQEPWVFENSVDIAHQVLESYDGGTIILANQIWQSFNGKIIKLNKAGDLLWEHSIEQNEEGLNPLTMVEDKLGNLYVGGGTFQYDEYGGDGFLLKLNACGEQQWFKRVGIPSELDWLQYLILGDNGSLYFNHFTGLSDVRFNLTKTDSMGDVLWNKPQFVAGELNVWGSNVRDFIRTKDKGFLMMGSVYAPPYYEQSTTSGWLRSGIVKTDSLGNEQWRHIYRWEEDEPDNITISSGGGNVDELADGTILVSALEKINSSFQVVVYKLSTNGELLWSKYVSKPNTVYDLTRSCITKDSTILVCTAASLPSNSFQRHVEVYKFDLQGNKLDEFIDDNNLVITRDFRLTKDSTSVCVLPAARYQNGAYNLYALKLNIATMELDTFLTEDNFEYDYYCPTGVEDQSIYFPDFITLDEEVEIKPQLKIGPNPAKDHTYIYVDVKNYQKNTQIEIRNLNGQLVNSHPILASNGRIYQDLSSYSPGIYLFSLVVDGIVVEVQEIIVME